MSDAAARGVEAAMTGLMNTQPFFASVLHTMEVSVEDSLPTSTIIVDGERVFIHPRFVLEHTEKELQAVLAKEAMHVVYKHHLRRGDRDARIWNLAASYVAIPLVLECGLYPPRGYLHDKDFENLSVEEVYEILKEDLEDDEEEIEQQFGRAAETGGIVIDPEDASKASGQGQMQLEADVRFAMAQASQQGKLPGSLKRKLDAGLERAVQWQELLLHELTRHGALDWSYARPSLFAPPDVILPTTHGMQAGVVVIAGDTSGSLSVEQLMDQIAETNAIIEQARPSLVWLVQCDEHVQHAEVLDGPIPGLQVAGGGGTRFQPVFDWIEEMEVNPDVLIYMTDCEGPAPFEPDYPVIWLSCSRKSGPFGTTIHTNSPN
jgi:predicted metal-dependent peptidase